jgi:UDP-3-O-acyl-N-acetylglucosamine deacetylase
MARLATQRLTGSVVFEGVGLFSGKPCRVAVRPGNGSGRLTAERADNAGPVFAADITSVLPSTRNTTIVPGGPAGAGEVALHGVLTTEHLFSALAAHMLFDVHLEVYGPEIPMMDNSALPFYERLKPWCAAGGPELDVLAPVRPLSMVDPADATVSMRATPPGGAENPAAATALELEYRLDYGADSPILPQLGAVGLGHDAADELTYGLMVAPARTFCTLIEAEQMNASGKFGHLQPRDVLVIGPKGPVENRYRMASEPAAHKLLDMLGDFHLSGRPLAGTFAASKTGHRHNHEMVRQLLAAESAGK